MQAPAIEALSLSDGYRAAVRWWRVEEPRGAVLYLHGIQSHGGWYEQSGGLLAERGLTVLMPDRRGSGLNQDQRGHVDSVERCLGDAQEMLDVLLKQTGFPAAHVVGVSWGGKLAVALAAAAPGKVRTLTLVAPGLFPRVDMTPVVKVRIAMAMVNDRHRLFDIPLNSPHYFTANPERIRFLENDVHLLQQVSASFLLASRHLDRRVRRFAKSPWRGSLHLMLAGRDKIIDNARTRDWLQNLPMPDQQITEYPEAEHTIEFEPDPRRFFDELTGWIEPRCGPASDPVRDVT
jgi:alpha-beta hydrolase superfamily lysophospholipase